jgi:ROS/MUCR transcriptional regulator protein
VRPPDPARAATRRIFGEPGQLDVDDDSVGCHLCGRRFKALGPHILGRHNLTVAEYRREFGLKASTGLISRRLRDTIRRTSPHLGAYQAANAGAVRGLSPEQRHRPRGQPISLEEARERRSSPKRQAAGIRRHDQFARRPCTARPSHWWPPPGRLRLTPTPPPYRGMPTWCRGGFDLAGERRRARISSRASPTSRW